MNTITNTKPNAVVVANIEWLIEKAGIKCVDLGPLIDKSRSLVSNWRNKGKMPSSPALEKVAELFGVAPHLLCRSEMKDVLAGTEITLHGQEPEQQPEGEQLNLQEQRLERRKLEAIERLEGLASRLERLVQALAA